MRNFVGLPRQKDKTVDLKYSSGITFAIASVAIASVLLTYRLSINNWYYGYGYTQPSSFSVPNINFVFKN